MSCGYDTDHPTWNNNSAVMVGIGKELAIITIETDHTVPLIDQLLWFEAQLASCRAAGFRHVIVAGHCPAFLVSASHNFEYVSQSRTLRGYFWPAMEDYADIIRFVLGGHEHMLTVTPRLRVQPLGTVTDPSNDDRFVQDDALGVRQIGSGPGGGTRLLVDPAKAGQVSSIDGTTTKCVGAMGYDSGTNSPITYGSITNASASTWHVWVARFSVVCPLKSGPP